MLSVERLASAYGRITALHGVDLSVAAGEIVTLVGSNGAGKTTLLKAIAGVQPVLAGRVSLDGEAITALSPHGRVQRGIALVPEGRQVFAPLSVADNLRLGAFRRRDPAAIRSDLDRIYAMFPILAERRTRPAGSLSGGQQQMLAIGRALMSGPRLLLLDEPSMGLAPIIVDQILQVLTELKAQGTTIFLVEQNAFAALSIADRGYVLETGRVVIEGTGAALLADNAVREAYLGI